MYTETHKKGKFLFCFFFYWYVFVKQWEKFEVTRDSGILIGY